MEIIEISEGVVELKEVSTVRRVKLTDFKNALIQSSGLRTPILPKGVIFYASKDYKKVYLIEREPVMAKVLYAHDRPHPKEFTLAFPWHYFLVLFENYAFETCYFYFRNKRIMTVEDKFSLPPLPNLHSPDCAVCLGDFRYQVTAETPEKMTGLINYFFASTFNDDLNQFFKEKIPKQIKALKRSPEEHCFESWQRLKIEDSCSVEWFPYQSLAKCLDNIWGKE
jgi:hypothetical protein